MNDKKAFTRTSLTATNPYNRKTEVINLLVVTSNETKVMAWQQNIKKQLEC